MRRYTLLPNFLIFWKATTSDKNKKKVHTQQTKALHLWLCLATSTHSKVHFVIVTSVPLPRGTLTHQVSSRYPHLVPNVKTELLLGRWASKLGLPQGNWGPHLAGRIAWVSSGSRQRLHRSSGDLPVTCLYSCGRRWQPRVGDNVPKPFPPSPCVGVKWPHQFVIQYI